MSQGNLSSQVLVLVSRRVLITYYNTGITTLLLYTVPCRGNIPRPAGRGSRVAGDPRVESKTDMHILINQPAGARVRTSSVYNVVTVCFTGFGYPKHIKTFTN